MIALKERLPELIIVPAHDMRAFSEMPTAISGKQRHRQGNTKTSAKIKDNGS